MSDRWFRFYDDTINDPKVLKLSDKTYRIWVGMLCLASKNNGVLPPFEDMVISLRVKASVLQPQLELLIAAELLDHTDNGISPHNWEGRQYKTDVTDPTNATRQKRYRERHKTVTPTVTAPLRVNDQIQSTDTDSEPNGSADPPPDPRTKLFTETLGKLAKITGKTPDSCRSLVGRWLKTVEDEAIHVIAAIEDAERNRIADPVAWINRTLKPRGSHAPKSPNGLAAALGKLRDSIEDDRREGGGSPSPRLLSSG